MNHVGFKIAYSTPREMIYFETAAIIGPSPSSSTLAPSRTRRCIPLEIARSMKALEGGNWSVIGGATMKIVLMSLHLVNGFA